MSNDTKKENRHKKANGCNLSHNNKGSFNRLMTQPSKQTTVSNQQNDNFLVNFLKHGSTYIGFMNVWKKSKCQKNQTNCQNPSKFVGNSTLNSINCKEIPLRHNMSRCRIRICRDIIVWMSLKFRIKRYLKSSSQSQRLSSAQIFRIKVWIKINQICLCLNTQRICRSILMQSCKMNQTQCCQKKGKQIMKAVKTIQCGVVS